MPILAHPDAVFLGMDVHKDSISVGILNPGHERPDVEKIFHDEESVRRLIDRFPDPSLLVSCYEAGPTGYDLARLLKSLGVRCEVIAPSMIPKASGDKVKTDARDCRRLARLHRAGELVAVRIPNPLEEAVRDLCRTRSDMVEDLTRARNRLTKFLLRHSRVWRDGSNWTVKHQAWLTSAIRRARPPGHFRPLPGRCLHPRRRTGRRRGRPAHLVRQAALRRSRAPAGRLSRGDLHGRTDTAGRGVRLATVRPGRPLHGLRRTGPERVLERAEHPPRAHHQGRQHASDGPAGRVRLVLPAPTLRRRRDRQATRGSPTRGGGRAWNAQLRLCGRFRHLAARKNTKSVVAAAIARELAGFLWAEMAA